MAMHVRFAPKATILHHHAIGREVPTAAVSNRSKQLSYSISSSARCRHPDYR
jgi:hypothetical protein